MVADELATVGDLARRWDLAAHKLNYAIERGRIVETARIGGMRVFNPDTQEQIRRTLKRIEQHNGVMA
ncbi:MAG: hypothetical protein ACYTF1_24180 [Planctomycetota bacterium]